MSTVFTFSLCTSGLGSLIFRQIDFDLGCSPVKRGTTCEQRTVVETLLKFDYGTGSAGQQNTEHTNFVYHRTPYKNPFGEWRDPKQKD